MKTGVKTAKRLFCILIALCLIIPCLPTFEISVTAEATQNQSAVADPSTANGYTTMLGTDVDGNRYSGSVWFDKSVYTWLDDESKLPLYSDFDKATADGIGMEIDSNFMVVGSALGSTTSVTTTTTSDAAIDVVIILDNSTSMYEESNRTSRLEKVVSAANKLIAGITANQNNRLAVVAYSGEAETLLPLDHYREKNNVLSITESGYGINKNYYYTATATPVGATRSVSETFSVSQWGTNVQIGVDMGMKILSNAKNTNGRMPVVILLTDGVANVASTKDWYAPTFANCGNHGNPTNQYVSFATLLTAAYLRSRITANYGGISPTVYGIGVDLSSNSDANVVMDPKNYLKPTGTNVATKTYKLFETWKNATETFSEIYNANDNTYTWNYEQLPSNYPGSKQDIIDNINYVDKYYPIGSENLSDTFDQILVEINEKAFVPLTDTIVLGDTEVNVPLTYVDFIGDYMEVKEFKAVTLFGNVYSVTLDAGSVSYTDTVDATTGIITRKEVKKYIVGDGDDVITNTVLGVSFNVSDAVKVTVTDTYTVELDDNGNYVKTGVATQEVRATASANSIPLIYDKVKNDNGTITYETNKGDVVPLRLYYTVDICSDIVDTNGNVITSKIDSEYLNANTNSDGTVNFYANRYGVMNTAEEGEALLYGDSHTAATPSTNNRYYFHQSNYPVYISVTNKDGSAVDWDEDEYGVLYYQGNGLDSTTDGNYLTEHMSYADISSLKDADQVYTLVNFYRPTTGTAGEAVGYIVYTDWGLLKTSIAFYDNVNGVYINGYDAGSNTFTTSETEGKAVDTSVVEAYLKANTSLKASDILCTLGVASRRVSRLANMTVTKSENVTGTAEYAYAPTYNTDSVHDGNLVVWLGNNGKMAVAPQQGIAVTKQVSEAVSGAETAFVFTVTVEGTDLSPAFSDKNGNTVTSVTTAVDTVNGVTNYTVTLTDGDTVYIAGLPADAAYTVAEAESVYYSPAYTNGSGKVESNTVTQVTVVNSPKKHGNLVITKEVIHPFGGNLDNEFAFTVTLSGVTAMDAAAIVIPDTASITYSGGIAVISGITVKDDGSVTISNIPSNAVYVVEETAERGFTVDTEETIGASGTIVADTSVTAAFVNNYTPTPPVNANITVSGNKTVRSNADISEAFTFKVQKYDPETDKYTDIDGASDTVTVSATAEGAIEIYEIVLNEEFTTVGTHFYRIIEVAGSNPHMVYDSNVGLFKVVVTDPGVIDGILVAEVETVANAAVSSDTSGFTVDMDFLNTYNANGTYVEVPVKKILVNDTGVTLPLNIFSFELDDGEGNVTTLNSDAKGEATFRIPVDTTGTFTYTLTEKTGALAGMSYSETEYTVTVEAVNKDGIIEATVTVTDGTNTYDTAEFVNTYSLTSVTGVKLNGVKTLENKNIENGQFSFTIAETDALYNVVANGWTATVSNTGNSFVFELPEYTKAGTYRYVITEVIPDTAVNNVYKGITYDPAVYHYTVVVSVDEADATKLSATTDLTRVGSGKVDTLSFTNSYNVTGSENVIINGEKSLTGRDLKGSEFIFAVYDKNGDNELAVTSNLSTGVIEFAPFTYTSSDIGNTYEYIVKEKIPTDAVNNVYNGVTYDTSEYTVTVTVSDDGEGNLVVTVDGNSGIKFENTYSVNPVTLSLAGTKKLNGKELKGDDFGFVLKDMSGNELQTVYNDKNGAFSFDDIEFDTVGEYVYTVSEVDDGKGGITYDETVYTVTVNVTDNGDGTLSAAKTISGVGSLEFTNTYTTKNAVASLGGVKKLDGRDMVEGEFAFRLYGAIVTDGRFIKNGEPLYTVTNKADGSFEFPDGSFSSEGTYYYVVDEAPGELGGVTYDDTVYEVTVTVADNGEGELIATVSVDKNGVIIFNNGYSAASDDVVIGGAKVLDGRDIEDGEFTFRLKDEDGNVVRETTNVGETFRFDAITYTVADTYKYTVSELNEGKGGVTYDDTVYEITVTVIDDGKGQLVATVSGADDIVFNNGYSASSDDVVIGGTKILDGRDIADGEFTFRLKDAEGNVLQTVSNGEDGSFAFEALEFTEAGEFVYTVVEVKGDKGGVTYDDTVYTVTVTVTDNGEGELVATATVSGDGELVFTNKYIPKETAVTVNGTKNLVGKDIEAEMFSFVLKDKDGNVLQTVYNDEDGLFEFAAVEFTKAGTYTFTVTEVIGDEEGMSYDATVYTVTAVVEDDGNGVLTATVTVSGDGAIVFNNEYDVGTPELGDASNMFVWCAAMLISVIGMAVLVINKRRTA